MKFGDVRYTCHRDQLEVSERGPMLVLGWTKPMGEMTAYLTLFRSGTGRCTLLQSSLPSLSSSELDYITPDKYIWYATAFNESYKRGRHADNPLGENHLTTRRRFLQSQYESRGVEEITFSQGGVEWHKARIGFITSTASHSIIDRDGSGYTSDEIALLENDIGMKLTYPPDTDEDGDDFRSMDYDELKAKKMNE